MVSSSQDMLTCPQDMLTCPQYMLTGPQVMVNAHTCDHTALYKKIQRISCQYSEVPREPV
jgi:hypothetical protein